MNKKEIYAKNLETINKNCKIQPNYSDDIIDMKCNLSALLALNNVDIMNSQFTLPSYFLETKFQLLFKRSIFSNFHQ